jgi:CheY-like chemotaxis protein
MGRKAQAGPHVCLSVTDTGEGMSSEVMNQIFDPFFTTKEVGDGTGLGLSTVAAIAASHGGFVNVYSEVGSGTTLRLYLPAHPPSDGGRTEEEEAAAGEALPRGGGELILVVDDEPSVREVTRQTLEAFGYRVETATDGADAVATYARLEDEVELVLTDLMMPIMDGPATIRALRRMNPKVKIIAASGLGADGGVTKAVDAGVARFLPKPYTAETLLQTIRAVLEEG